MRSLNIKRVKIAFLPAEMEWRASQWQDGSNSSLHWEAYADTQPPYRFREQKAITQRATHLRDIQNPDNKETRA